MKNCLNVDQKISGGQLAQCKKREKGLTYHLLHTVFYKTSGLHHNILYQQAIHCLVSWETADSKLGIYASYCP
jgi:hypothetical protein